MSAAAGTGATTADLYQADIMDRARRPRHQGLLEGADGTAEARNPLCGDRVTVTIRRAPDGRIAACAHQARACAICAASCDLMAEMLPGLTEAGVRQAAQGFAAALRQGATLPAASPLNCFTPLRDTPSRIGCALLPWEALLQSLTTDLAP